VIAKSSKAGEFVAKALTKDHKPDIPKEKRRIV